MTTLTDRKEMEVESRPPVVPVASFFFLGGGVRESPLQNIGGLINPSIVLFWSSGGGGLNRNPSLINRGMSPSSGRLSLLEQNTPPIRTGLLIRGQHVAHQRSVRLGQVS